MADNMEVIISAIDEASEIFSTIAASCQEMMEEINDSATEASEGIDTIGESATEIESAIDTIDPSNIEDINGAASDASSGVDGLSDSLNGASDAAEALGDSIGIIEGAMLLGAAEQIGSLAGNTENMAQEMNTASIAVGQLATNVGMAEPQMVDLINNISNATFPQNEAMAYVQALNQMGVSADKLGDSATNMDRINDATHIGYNGAIQLTAGLQSVGVEADNLPSAFNAIAYAQANVTGGTGTLTQVLKTQAATINEYGLNTDQLVLIMEKLSEKGVQGRKMGAELSSVLKENNGDIQAIEESLGMEIGSLENATDATNDYEGQLQKLADEEAEHKTILDQVGAAWEDVTLKMSGVLAPAAGAISAIGEVGSLGMSIRGIKELGTTFNQLKETKYGMAAANYAQAASETVLSAATSAYGVVVGVLTGEIGLAEAATMAWNAVLAMNPLVLVAVAAVALAVAVYEVGKAFGWWTDVSSMIDAIWAGIQRLWSAFANHPDVQAIFKALTDAWDSIVSAISPVIDAIKEFFTINTGGDFDIVRALIEAIGIAWEAMTLPIRTIIDLFGQIYNIGSKVANGQLDLVAAVMNVWTLLSNFFNLVLVNIVNMIVSWGGQIVSNAIIAASDFVNNIMDHIKTLPSRFLSYLTRTTRNIVNQVNRWVTNARNGAKRMVDGAISFIKQLPGKVLGYMHKVATSITNGAKNWATNASKKAKGIVDGVTSTISGLPTKVYNKMLEIGEKLLSVGSSLYNKAKDVGKNIWNGLTSALGGGTGAGFEIGGAAGFDMSTGQEFNIYTGETYEVKDTTDININEKLDVVFDFKNLPDDVDEGKLLQLVEKFITDKSVIKRLVEDPTFQSLDAKVKEKILSKAKRANGA